MGIACRTSDVHKRPVGMKNGPYSHHLNGPYSYNIIFENINCPKHQFNKLLSSIFQPVIAMLVKAFQEK